MPIVRSFLIFIIISFPLFAQDDKIIILLKDGETYDVMLHTEFYEEKDGVLSYEEISKKKFVKNTIGANFSYSEDVLWFRLKINSSEVQKVSDWIFVVEFPQIDYINFYFLLNDGSVLEKKGGDRFPFEKREIKNRNPNFSIPANVQNNSYVYFRIQTTSLMIVPVYITTKEKFNSNDHHAQILIGLFLGIIFIMICYNFILYTSLKDKVYLHYCAFAFSILLFSGSFYGLGYEYLWSESAYMQSIMIGVGGHLGLFFSITFSRVFLKTKFNAPFLDLILNLCLIITFAGLILLIINGQNHFSNLLIRILLLFCSLMLPITGIRCWINGNKSARIYLLGWIPICFAYLLYFFRTIGFFNQNVFQVSFSLQIANLLEAVIFSFALADRINILTKQKLEAEEKIKIHLEKSNQELDEKVKLQTKYLTNVLDKVKNLKKSQDGDYFLLSLLIEPLSEINFQSKNVKMDFLIKQKKRFVFRKNKGEIGGDINVCHSISLGGKNYIVFINADAMGKSLQGAGGTLVFGSVFKSIIERTRVGMEGWLTPEMWISNTFIEIHKVFETFSGMMLVSGVFCLLEEETGKLYYMISDHPNIVLYRDKKASFVESNKNYPKLGVGFLEQMEIYIDAIQLKIGDCIIIGSDGKDDVLLGLNESGFPNINSDGNLFLTHVENADGELLKIYKEILKIGKQYDDISMIKLELKSIS